MQNTTLVQDTRTWAVGLKKEDGINGKKQNEELLATIYML
jgi:hypothetical protein